MYEIIAVHTQYGKEVVDIAETVKEAKFMVCEYRIAFSAEWLIRYVKRGS